MDSSNQINGRGGMVEYSYSGVEIVVQKGDITKIEVEAIVNPANSFLIMGGGVAGAIKRAGGPEIEAEARRMAPIPIGKAVITGGGALKAKYVIHAPTMSRPAMATNKENVALAVRAALSVARENDIESIAFPGMGTGVGGLSYGEAADVMVSETVKHIEEGTSLKKIIFVGFSDELTEAFMKAWNKALSPKTQE